MVRDTGKLANRKYDLVVIGGGIFGACVAWDAVLRGLDVALIEKDDFCQATSANHFKMIHGGMRYLQHLDLKRVRESSRERSILFKTAPHLAKPLPILMPTYGHGMRGKEILKTGLWLYDMLTLARNKGIKDQDRQIPRFTCFTKEEVLSEYPGIESKNLTGGVLFCDGQIYNPPRLVLSYIRSAVKEGLDTANYIEAVDYIFDDNRVSGVMAEDRLTGDRFEIHSKFVINAAGPWAHNLNNNILGKSSARTPSFSRDLVIVVPKVLSRNYALAYMAKTQDKDALLDRGGRHLFIVPWRNYSLIGVWHKAFNRMPDEITIEQSELYQFLDEINNAYRDVQLSVDDISFINTGLILFGAENEQGGKRNHSFAKRSMIIDHSREHNIEGLMTLIGVRATVARKDAQATIDTILQRLNINARESTTSTTAIYGGRIENFSEYCRQAAEFSQRKYGFKVSNSMIHNYGAEYRAVLKYIDEEPSIGREIEATGVIKAEVVHAVREEMAVKLQDVIFRRTEIGTGEKPTDRAIETTAELMAGELGWDNEKEGNEVAEVLDIFSRQGPWKIV